jgi:hypothetical protein
VSILSICTLRRLRNVAKKIIISQQLLLGRLVGRNDLGLLDRYLSNFHMPRDPYPQFQGHCRYRGRLFRKTPVAFDKSLPRADPNAAPA